MLYYVNSKFFSVISAGNIEDLTDITYLRNSNSLSIEAGEVVVLLEKNLQQRVIKFLSCRGICMTSVSIFKRYCSRVETF